MRLRKALLGVAGAALAVGMLASPAQATEASAHEVSASEASAQAPRWQFFDSYFWGSTCRDVGRRGVETGSWLAWQCRDGSWISDYKLYVLR